MLYCALPGSMEICLAVATAAAQLPASSSSLLPRQRPHPETVAQLQAALDELERTPAEQQPTLARGLLTVLG